MKNSRSVMRAAYKAMRGQSRFKPQTEEEKVRMIINATRGLQLVERHGFSWLKKEAPGNYESLMEAAARETKGFWELDIMAANIRYVKNNRRGYDEGDLDFV